MVAFYKCDRKSHVGVGMAARRLAPAPIHLLHLLLHRRRADQIGIDGRVAVCSCLSQRSAHRKSSEPLIASRSRRNQPS